VDTSTIGEKLRKLEEKYLHESLPEQERLELRERIFRLQERVEEATVGRS
jgi:hypothetical protein